MNTGTQARALLSVSDKTAITALATALQARGYQLVSTGGTAKTLLAAGLEVMQVAEVTGFAEMMDGRVKTLHPAIHGGILARRGKDDEALAANAITPIDVVVVNLYPFQQTISKADCSFADAIENIDIGGPAMVRAAAKNHQDVTVITDPADYPELITRLEANSPLDEVLRRRLAAKAFAHTAHYDSHIAGYLQSQIDNSEASFPQQLTLGFNKVQDLRYGENPHQAAAFYSSNEQQAGLASAQQLQGKALSYNNIADADAALNCVRQFAAQQAACVIVKHANPCGVCLAKDQLEAYNGAYATDPESAFGGIIAFNQTLDVAAASAIIERQFVEVIIAPAISKAAAEILATKPNVRALICADLSETASQWHYQRVTGGLLVQGGDDQLMKTCDVVTARQPTAIEQQSLEFAWRVAKFVKSNAIVYAKGAQTIGVGAGQMSRVNSARIAAIKAAHAGFDVKGAVMASDAFFPFADAIENARDAGIRAIIQPGGSMRDDEVIAAADAADMAMIFTGMRHFRH